MKVKVTTSLLWPFHRQIPKAKDKNLVEFYINEQIDTCDAWIVYQGLFRPETTYCPPENIILLTYEPPGLHQYQSGFLKQFNKVVTCQRSIHHPGIVYWHQAQPWLAGLRRYTHQNIHQGLEVNFTFDDFAVMGSLPKNKNLSVLCSNKVMSDGHRQRLEFVEILRRELGEAVDIFGYGFQPVEDKWDALAPYKYHIVLENSIVDDYWTEKLADAYLGFCFPIFSGCPNLSRYFPTSAYHPIDISKPDRAIQQIQELLVKDPYELHLASISEARRRVLYEYNLFTEILSLVTRNQASKPQKITLKDERLFLPGGWVKPWIRPLKDWWNKQELSKKAYL